MAIVSVKELFKGRSGSSSGISAIEQKRILLVLTNNGNDDFITILAGYPGPGPVAMPALYDPLNGNYLLTCRSVSGSQHEDKGAIYWRLEYTYSSAPIDREKFDRELYPNPLDRPARASGKASRYTTVPKAWRFVTAGEPAATETAVNTSAGEPFDSLEEIDDSRWSFHFSKNYPATDLPNFLFDWDPDSVNEFECFLLGQLCAARTLKLIEPHFGDVMRENNIDYRVVEFDIEFKADGWDYKVPDRGFSYLKAGKLTKITNPDGTFPTVPQLLDGSGGILANPETAAVVTREGAVYDEQDFEELPIDESDVDDEGQDPIDPEGDL